MLSQEKAIYFIKGQVVDLPTLQGGIPGLQVEIWDRDICYDVLVRQ
jgi:hypothetical protein